jgi:mRNA-degrading endonuclease toxin of MazEF toxin-antitoxin module
MQDLSRKRRPVVVLSSSFHNQSHGARVLIVPVSSVVNNTALHRLIISPNGTRLGQVIKTDSNLLFDYTTMISSSYLKPTEDALQYDVLQHTLTWWHRCVKAIVADD